MSIRIATLIKVIVWKLVVEEDHLCDCQEFWAAGGQGDNDTLIQAQETGFSVKMFDLYLCVF